MRATYWICLGLCAGLSAGLASCKDLDQCDDPGAVEACMCSGDDPGARVCNTDYVWGDCDCGAEVPDSGVTGGMGGMTGGVGGATGGMGGMPTDGGDTDAMTGGMGGGDPMGPGYVGCTVATAATDCGAGAECRESDAPFLGEPLFVCAPACAMPSDCPDAPAGGAATVECTDGHCVLTCSTNLLMLVECPTGFTCAAKAAVESCYDDGI